MFRQDALENRRMKWRGRAILLPGIPLWLTMLGSIAFITAFLTFVIAGTYSRRVNVSGEVTTWPRAVNIYSGVQGFVVRQFVHEGQSIKKGDPIYQIDVSKSTRSGVVTDNQRRDIENQLVRVDNIISRLEESKKNYAEYAGKATSAIQRCVPSLIRYYTAGRGRDKDNEEQHGELQKLPVKRAD